MLYDPSPMAPRRSVLKVMGAATLAALSDTALRGAGVVTPWRSPIRYDQAMRWVQVAFTEDDPGRWDPQFWFDYFKRIRADGVCVSAGGSIAFYPSKVPYHYRAADLGNSDIFGDMVQGCRSLGMSVIARVDPHALSTQSFQAHPEWVARTQNGAPRPHWAAADFYVACVNGPFMSSFMPEVIEEIGATYNVDGFFGNRWGGSGLCFCASCQKQFKSAYGYDIPESLGLGSFQMPPLDHPQRDAAHAYLLWFNEMRVKQIALWTQSAKKRKPSAFFVGGPTSGALEIDPTILTAYSPILISDHQARSGYSPPWHNGCWAKQMRSFMQAKPIVGIFSIGVEEAYRWKDSVQSGPELNVWVEDGVAHGFRPWMAKFNAKPIDARWMPVVEDRYRWLAKNEAYLKNTQNLARVAMVYSPETQVFHGSGAAHMTMEDAQSGYYHALIEARIPFEMLDSRQLDREHVDRFRVLVLPNIAALSDRQCKQIIDYVGRGGRIVATHETSLYDAAGKPRHNFGLADLFDCDFAGKIDQRVQNSYLTIRGNHPLVRGLEDTPRIIGTVKRVHVTPRGQTPQPITLVPTYPDLPMERVFMSKPTTDIPMVFCRDLGRARLVYFPMDLDRTFWEIQSSDHLALLRNAVEWVADEPSLIQIDGAGVLDVSIWRQKRSITVHLVNLTNPMMMKGPFREIIPAGPFILRVTLAAGDKVSRVRLLESDLEVRPQMIAGQMVIDVPKVSVHEIVALDLISE